jgi:hypothetical protein
MTFWIRNGPELRLYKNPSRSARHEINILIAQSGRTSSPQHEVL